jgi:hypothetical protein
VHHLKLSGAFKIAAMRAVSSQKNEMCKRRNEPNYPYRRTFQTVYNTKTCQSATIYSKPCWESESTMDFQWDSGSKRSFKCRSTNSQKESSMAFDPPERNFHEEPDVIMRSTRSEQRTKHANDFVRLSIPTPNSENGRRLEFKMCLTHEPVRL